MIEVHEMEKTMIEKDDLAEFQWESREEGFAALEHEVIYRELCSGCGLCVAVCPEDVIGFGEYPRLIGKCVNCGYCLMACPRSFLPKAEVEERLLGEAGGELGVVKGVYSVRTKEKGQDGGFVTALLKYMLKKKLVDGAVVSDLDPSKPWKPMPRIARTAVEIETAAGSRYSTSPNLMTLKVAKQKGLKVAVVGTPCHLDGAAKLKAYPVEGAELGDLVRYTVAVFCKSNFIYPMVGEHLAGKEGIDLAKVDKMDIKGKHLIVYEGGKEKKILLKDIHGYERLGCKVCDDFTGRFSDFSVGSVDSEAGYSTVITRTKEADRILKDMKKEGLIEVKAMGVDGLPVAHKLAEQKKSRARKEVAKIRRDALPLPLKYLGE
ncbi:MAG: coenzyme F420 hydrogenase subunit beta [Methanobacteriota archaeon]|nr:MAG: coenzyme F420 hydrogenase subunit beta [Euryarchaeota archaeon]